jgi:cold shock CspA family protein
VHTKGDGGRDTKDALPRPCDAGQRTIHTAEDKAVDTVTVGSKSDSSQGDSGGNAATTGEADDLDTDACNTRPCTYAKDDDQDEDMDEDQDEDEDQNEDQNKKDQEREADADSETQVVADAPQALNELDRVNLGVHILRTLSLQVTHKENNRFLVQQYEDTAGEWTADASKQQWFQTLDAATCFLRDSQNNDKTRRNKRKYSIFTEHADARRAEGGQTNTSKCKSVKREREMETPHHHANGRLRQEDCAIQSDVVRSNNTRRRYGTVVHWYEKRGFGFVSEEDCGNSIFLHISNVTTRQRSLVSGQQLSYDEYFDKQNNKYTAVNASIRNTMAMTAYSPRVQPSPPRSHVLASHTPNKRYYHDERGNASNNNSLHDTEFDRRGFAVCSPGSPYTARYAPLVDMPWQFVHDQMYDRDNTYQPPSQGNSRDAYARHQQHKNLKAHGIVCTLLLLILSLHISVHCSILEFFQFLTTPTKPHCVNRTAV